MTHSPLSRRAALAGATLLAWPGAARGAERILQRLMQEYGSNVRNADVIESSDKTRHSRIFGA